MFVNNYFAVIELYHVCSLDIYIGNGHNVAQSACLPILFIKCVSQYTMFKISFTANPNVNVYNILIYIFAYSRI